MGSHGTFSASTVLHPLVGVMAAVKSFAHKLYINSVVLSGLPVSGSHRKCPCLSVVIRPQILHLGVIVVVDRVAVRNGRPTPQGYPTVQHIVGLVSVLNPDFYIRLLRIICSVPLYAYIRTVHIRFLSTYRYPTQAGVRAFRIPYQPLIIFLRKRRHRACHNHRSRHKNA